MILKSKVFIKKILISCNTTIRMSQKTTIEMSVKTEQIRGTQKKGEPQNERDTDNESKRSREIKNHFTSGVR
jgi:hypothetical protein